MTIRLVSTLFLVVFIIIKPTWADTNLNNTNYWQCTAYDDGKKQWVIKSLYERVAANKALDACKKQSTAPTSCKMRKEICEYFAHGLSTRPMWQCTALDQTAKPWMGGTYSNQDDAALGAKVYCQQHSILPGTCFINLLTCKNLSERG